MTIVYLNGRLLPVEEAHLSPLDHGFLYGYGLFETMRAYGGRVFRLERHLARMAASARALGMACPDPQALASAVTETLQANSLREARIRISLSAGEAEAVPNPKAYGTPTLFILARPYTPPTEAEYARGYRGQVAQARLFIRSPMTGHKTAHYLPYILARREALAAGANEAIILNERGFVVEGGTSNLFLVASDTLVTPSRSAGILPGITREAVLELAEALGLKAVERGVRPQELGKCQEAFLTNSVVEIMALTAVNGERLGQGREGHVTRRLRLSYRELVSQETSP